MIVDMWMKRDVVVIDSGESITAAAALMANNSVRRLPVVDRRADGLHVMGIVTLGDIHRAYPSHVNPLAAAASGSFHSDVTVLKVMKRHPFTTAPEAPIEEPAQTMCRQKIGGLPVVQKELLVGIITESDIFRAFASILESPPGSVRITFNVARDEDIFGLLNRLASPRKVKVLSLISSRHHNTPVCVVRLAGGELDKLLDDIWKSGHQVVNVLRIH
ncbi:MAG: CBS domain-containing protein [Planctomycetia bacterium]|nr:CBS domain-containing protein [Planctomycetia bacterium]